MLGPNNSAVAQPTPQKSVADLIMDHIRRVKEQNAGAVPPAPDQSAATASAPNAQNTAAGGFPAWLGSVAGIDPSNPFQPTPPVEPSTVRRLVRVPPQ